MSISEIRAADMPDLKARLAGLLYEKSYMEGDFTLSSGRKANYYFDCRQTSLNPEGAWLIGSILLRMLEGTGARAVAGMTLGADPLVTATSMAAYDKGIDLPALIVRKEPKGHGAGRCVEGLANIPQGAGVVMLEDVVSTGGSVLKACKRIEEAGLRILFILCILNRQEAGCAEAFAKSGYDLRAVYTREELISLAGSR